MLALLASLLVLAAQGAQEAQSEVTSKIPDWPIWVWGVLIVGLMFIGYIVSSVLKYFVWLAVGAVAFVVGAPYILGDRGEEIQNRVLTAVNLAEVKECATAVNETGSKDSASKLAACGNGAAVVKKGVEQRTQVKQP